MLSKMIKIKSLSDFKELERKLTERWLDLEQNSNAFRYKLNVKKQKILDGKLRVLMQVSDNNLQFFKSNNFLNEKLVFDSFCFD